MNAANEHHGRLVYRFLRDELGAKWMQFIPIVERASEETIAVANQGWSVREDGRKRLLYTQTGNLVTERSVGGRQYGQFLIDVFEEWVRHDIATVFVQMFDVTLEAFFGRHLLCIHAPTCGYGPALEHNGDLYSCDHFVEPDYLLGNIHDTHMVELISKPEQRKFGQDKRDTLTTQCQECKVRHLCNGGCPKDRFTNSRDGEAGQNYLCEGLELFFMHTGPAFTAMAQLLQRNLAPSDIMSTVKAEDARRGPYQPCPCGSGEKFRFCHGPKAAPLTVHGCSALAGLATRQPVHRHQHGTDETETIEHSVQRCLIDRTRAQRRPTATALDAQVAERRGRPVVELTVDDHDIVTEHHRMRSSTRLIR